MSGNSTPRGMAQQPKQISSRLLNMKFMQRAAATEKQKPQSASNTPSSEPPRKRRRTGDYPQSVDSPVTPTTAAHTPSNQHNSFRAEADIPLTPRGRNNFEGDTFETQWVLDVKAPQMNGTIHHNVGHNAADTDEDDSHDEIWGSSNPSGRQTYGSVKKKKGTSTKSTNVATTPLSTSKSAKRNLKRKHDSGTRSSSVKSDFNSQSDSECGSNSDASTEESDETGEASSEEEEPDAEFAEDRDATATGKRKKPAVDFTSEEYLRKMDEMDFSKAGLNGGLGRQRAGLGQGGGGRGGGGGGGLGSRGTTPKTRKSLAGQQFFGKNNNSHNKNKTRNKTQHKKRKTM